MLLSRLIALGTILLATTSAVGCVAPDADDDTTDETATDSAAARRGRGGVHHIPRPWTPIDAADFWKIERVEWVPLANCPHDPQVKGSFCKAGLVLHYKIKWAYAVGAMSAEVDPATRTVTVTANILDAKRPHEAWEGEFFPATMTANAFYASTPEGFRAPGISVLDLETCGAPYKLVINAKGLRGITGSPTLPEPEFVPCN